MSMGLPLPAPYDGETSPLWGVELVMDIKSCDPGGIRSGATIRRYVDDLVKSIGMEAFEEPLLARFALHNPDAAGYSVAQLITTSLVSGHFSEGRNTAYLNIFSCQEYAVDDAMTFTEKFFKATVSKHWVLRRGTHE